MRSVIQGHHLALDRSELERLRGEEALGPVEELHELGVAARDARDGQPGALPDVVVVDLGHGRAEAPLELSLDGQELLPLPLQRVVVREVELDRQDADVAGAHARRLLGVVRLWLVPAAPPFPATERSVRSISRVS